jgi:hypothetical protein
LNFGLVLDGSTLVVRRAIRVSVNASNANDLSGRWKAKASIILMPAAIVGAAFRTVG